MTLHRSKEITRVFKWGNSLAVRLPKKLVEEFALRAGDELNLVDAADRPIALKRGRRRKRALERLGSINLTLPADYKFGRD